MIYNVKEGASLHCTLGTSKSTLKVPFAHVAVLQGKNQASIIDNKVGVNIFPFGMCNRVEPPVPCTPALCMKWQITKSTHKLDGENALLNTGILPCMLGGIISIDRSGQKED